MTSTLGLKVADLLEWLDKNAYWRQGLEVRPSKMGGFGVFYKAEAIKHGNNKNALLLRIPKLNILAAKNSLIYNLLIDYVPKNPNVDLGKGMFSLILAVLYEISIQDRSPWYGYLNSMDFSQLAIPLCLWEKNDRENFGNTEVDLRNLLSHDELFEFYVEAVCFAKHYSSLIPIPKVLDISEELVSISIVLQNYKLCLVDFGKVMQAVVSRSFDIDSYYELALVPGADLFNHIDPDWNSSTQKMVPRENIHFVCDSQVCDLCGDKECDHSDDEEVQFSTTGETVSSSSEAVMTLEDNPSAGSSVDTIEEESEDEEENLNSIFDGMSSKPLGNNPESHAGVYQDANKLDGYPGSISEPKLEPNSKPALETEPLLTEITLEYIKKLEENNSGLSDAETMEDYEELSTVLMEDPDSELVLRAQDADLAQELSNASKCCDVVLVLDPLPEYNHEIFNLYGYEPNANLLHRYGFTAKQNVHDSCLLSVQLFRYLNHLKLKLSQEKLEHLENKLSWLEMTGFDAINKLVYQMQDCCTGENDTLKDHNCDHSEESEFGQVPESWPLSLRILFSGKCSPQTYAILSLIEMPYKMFKLKMRAAKSHAHLLRAVGEQLLSPTAPTKKFDSIIKTWCKERLDRYPPLQPSAHYDTIYSLVENEKAILNKFIANH